MVAFGIFDDVLMIIGAGVLVTSLVITSLKLGGEHRKIGFALAIFSAFVGVSLLLRNLPYLGFTGDETTLEDASNALFVIAVIVGVYTSVSLEKMGRSGAFMGIRRH